jgi:phytoene synthase
MMTILMGARASRAMFVSCMATPRSHARASVRDARAQRGIAELPPDCRTAIYAARLLYAAIGSAIARGGFDAVTRRARVPWWRKALLLMRALGAPLLRRQREVAPPLDATRFLVTACGEAP